MKKVLVLGVIALSSASCSASCNRKVTVVDKKEQTSTKETKKMADTITKTASGLGYTVITAAPADARSPKAGDLVTVHYTGWLESKENPGQPDVAKKFDSSVDRGQKFSFKIGIGQVIKGWDEGVMAMKVGEKRRLVIPSDLGYGSRGAGGLIPGGATLIFDVELFDTKSSSKL